MRPNIDASGDDGPPRPPHADGPVEPRVQQDVQIQVPPPGTEHREPPPPGVVPPPTRQPSFPDFRATITEVVAPDQQRIQHDLAHRLSRAEFETIPDEHWLATAYLNVTEVDEDFDRARGVVRAALGVLAHHGWLEPEGGGFRPPQAAVGREPNPELLIVPALESPTTGLVAPSARANAITARAETAVGEVQAQWRARTDLADQVRLPWPTGVAPLELVAKTWRAVAELLPRNTQGQGVAPSMVWWLMLFLNERGLLRNRALPTTEELIEITGLPRAAIHQQQYHLREDGVLPPSSAGQVVEAGPAPAALGILTRTVIRSQRRVDPLHGLLPKPVNRFDHVALYRQMSADLQGEGAFPYRVSPTLATTSELAAYYGVGAEVVSRARLLLALAGVVSMRGQAGWKLGGPGDYEPASLAVLRVFHAGLVAGEIDPYVCAPHPKDWIEYLQPRLPGVALSQNVVEDAIRALPIVGLQFWAPSIPVRVFGARLRDVPPRSRIAATARRIQEALFQHPSVGRLPRTKDLAEQLGVHSDVVQSALSRLHFAGAISAVPDVAYFRGAHVPAEPVEFRTLGPGELTPLLAAKLADGSYRVRELLPTYREIGEAAGASMFQVQKSVRELADQGLLAMEGSTRSPRWRVTGSSDYQPREPTRPAHHVDRGTVPRLTGSLLVEMAVADEGTAQPHAESLAIRYGIPMSTTRRLVRLVRLVGATMHRVTDPLPTPAEIAANGDAGLLADVAFMRTYQTIVASQELIRSGDLGRDVPWDLTTPELAERLGCSREDVVAVRAFWGHLYGYGADIRVDGYVIPLEELDFTAEPGGVERGILDCLNDPQSVARYQGMSFPASHLIAEKAGVAPDEVLRIMNQLSEEGGPLRKVALGRSGAGRWVTRFGEPTPDEFAPIYAIRQHVAPGTGSVGPPSAKSSQQPVEEKPPQPTVERLLLRALTNPEWIARLARDHWEALVRPGLRALATQADVAIAAAEADADQRWRDFRLALDVVSKYRPMLSKSSALCEAAHTVEERRAALVDLLWRLRLGPSRAVPATSPPATPASGPDEPAPAGPDAAEELERALARIAAVDTATLQGMPESDFRGAALAIAADVGTLLDSADDRCWQALDDLTSHLWTVALRMYPAVRGALGFDEWPADSGVDDAVQIAEQHALLAAYFRLMNVLAAHRSEAPPDHDTLELWEVLADLHADVGTELGLTPINESDVVAEFVGLPDLPPGWDRMTLQERAATVATWVRSGFFGSEMVSNELMETATGMAGRDISDLMLRLEWEGVVVPAVGDRIETDSPVSLMDRVSRWRVLPAGETATVCSVTYLLANRVMAHQESGELLRQIMDRRVLQAEIVTALDAGSQPRLARVFRLLSWELGFGGELLDADDLVADFEVVGAPGSPARGEALASHLRQRLLARDPRTGGLQLRPGQRLPQSEAIAEELGGEIASSTVAGVYDRLADEGLVIATVGGWGWYVPNPEQRSAVADIRRTLYSERFETAARPDPMQQLRDRLLAMARDGSLIGSRLRGTSLMVLSKELGVSRATLATALEPIADQVGFGGPELRVGQLLAGYTPDDWGRVVSGLTRQLRAALRNARPGSHLPNAQAIADAAGCTNRTVLDAMEPLVAEGLLLKPPRSTKASVAPVAMRAALADYGRTGIWDPAGTEALAAFHQRLSEITNLPIGPERYLAARELVAVGARLLPVLWGAFHTSIAGAHDLSDVAGAARRLTGFAQELNRILGFAYPQRFPLDAHDLRGDAARMHLTDISDAIDEFWDRAFELAEGARPSEHQEALLAGFDALDVGDVLAAIAELADPPEVVAARDRWREVMERMLALSAETHDEAALVTPERAATLLADYDAILGANRALLAELRTLPCPDDEAYRLISVLLHALDNHGRRQRDELTAYSRGEQQLTRTEVILDVDFLRGNAFLTWLNVGEPIPPEVIRAYLDAVAAGEGTVLPLDKRFADFIEHFDEATATTTVTQRRSRLRGCAVELGQLLPDIVERQRAAVRGGDRAVQGFERLAVLLAAADVLIRELHGDDDARLAVTQLATGLETYNAAAAYSADDAFTSESPGQQSPADQLDEALPEQRVTAVADGLLEVGAAGRALPESTGDHRRNEVRAPIRSAVAELEASTDPLLGEVWQRVKTQMVDGDTDGSWRRQLERRLNGLSQQAVTLTAEALGVEPPAEPLTVRVLTRSECAATVLRYHAQRGVTDAELLEQLANVRRGAVYLHGTNTAVIVAESLNQQLQHGQLVAAVQILLSQAGHHCLDREPETEAEVWAIAAAVEYAAHQNSQILLVRAGEREFTGAMELFHLATWRQWTADPATAPHGTGPIFLLLAAAALDGHPGSVNLPPVTEILLAGFDDPDIFPAGEDPVSWLVRVAAAHYSVQLNAGQLNAVAQQVLSYFPNQFDAGGAVADVRWRPSVTPPPPVAGSDSAAAGEAIQSPAVAAAPPTQAVDEPLEPFDSEYRLGKEATAAWSLTQEVVDAQPEPYRTHLLKVRAMSEPVEVELGGVARARVVIAVPKSLFRIDGASTAFLDGAIAAVQADIKARRQTAAATSDVQAMAAFDLILREITRPSVTKMRPADRRREMRRLSQWARRFDQQVFQNRQSALVALSPPEELPDAAEIATVREAIRVFGRELGVVATAFNALTSMLESDRDPTLLNQLTSFVCERAVDCAEVIDLIPDEGMDLRWARLELAALAHHTEELGKNLAAGRTLSYQRYLADTARWNQSDATPMGVSVARRIYDCWSRVVGSATDEPLTTSNVGPHSGTDDAAILRFRAENESRDDVIRFVVPILRQRIDWLRYILHQDADAGIRRAAFGDVRYLLQTTQTLGWQHEIVHGWMTAFDAIAAFEGDRAARWRAEINEAELIWDLYTEPLRRIGDDISESEVREDPRTARSRVQWAVAVEPAATFVTAVTTQVEGVTGRRAVLIMTDYGFGIDWGDQLTIAQQQFSDDVTATVADDYQEHRDARTGLSRNAHAVAAAARYHSRHSQQLGVVCLRVYAAQSVEGEAADRLDAVALTVDATAAAAGAMTVAAGAGAGYRDFVVFAPNANSQEVLALASDIASRCHQLDPRLRIEHEATPFLSVADVVPAKSLGVLDDELARLSVEVDGPDHEGDTFQSDEDLGIFAHLRALRSDQRFDEFAVDSLDQPSADIPKGVPAPQQPFETPAVPSVETASEARLAAQIAQAKAAGPPMPPPPPDEFPGWQAATTTWVSGPDGSVNLAEFVIDIAPGADPVAALGEQFKTFVDGPYVQHCAHAADVGGSMERLVAIEAKVANGGPAHQLLPQIAGDLDEFFGVIRQESQPKLWFRTPEQIVFYASGVGHYGGPGNVLPVTRLGPVDMEATTAAYHAATQVLIHREINPNHKAEEVTALVPAMIPLLGRGLELLLMAGNYSRDSARHVKSIHDDLVTLLDHAREWFAAPRDSDPERLEIVGATRTHARNDIDLIRARVTRYGQHYKQFVAPQLQRMGGRLRARVAGLGGNLVEDLQDLIYTADTPLAGVTPPSLRDQAAALAPTPLTGGSLLVRYQHRLASHHRRAFVDTAAREAMVTAERIRVAGLSALLSPDASSDAEQIVQFLKDLAEHPDGPAVDFYISEDERERLPVEALEWLDGLNRRVKHRRGSNSVRLTAVESPQVLLTTSGMAHGHAQWWFSERDHSLHLAQPAEDQWAQFSVAAKSDTSWIQGDIARRRGVQ